MKGDFSRRTFSARKGYSRVLMQQGRVLLDADWNEQADIFVDAARDLAYDIIGPVGGPARRLGFEVNRAPSGDDYTIGEGRYYVNGIPCWCPAGVTHMNQPFRHAPRRDEEAVFYFFLDVWERHVTPVEAPDLYDPALGGIDTATRSQVVWQTRRSIHLDDASLKLCRMVTQPGAAEKMSQSDRSKTKALVEGYLIEVRRREVGVEPTLVARFSRSSKADLRPHERAGDNHLYRVEVHDGGDAGEASLKWSRDNGTVVFPVTAVTAGKPGEIEVEIERTRKSRDPRTAIDPGDLVELSCDADEFEGMPGVLAKVAAVNGARVRLQEYEESRQRRRARPSETRDERMALFQNKRPRARLRRWDGYFPDVRRLLASTKLEGAIEIQLGADSAGVRYQTGDHWLLPVRLASAPKILWPTAPGGEPQPIAPKAIHHSYAPLAVVCEGKLFDLRRSFHGIAL